MGEAVFAAGSAIYMLIVLLYSAHTYFSDTLTVLIDIYSLVYLAFMIVFSLFRKKRQFTKFSYAAFIVMLLIAAVSFTYLIRIQLSANSILGEAVNVGIAFAIIFPTTAIAVFGFYFIRTRPLKKYARTIGVVLLIAAIVLFFYYEIYGFGYKGVNADDETVLSYYAFKAMQSGHDPYGINIKSILMSNSTSYGFTLTTANKIVGYLDYPILFVLVLAPFYYLAHGSAGEVIYAANSAAYLAFIIVTILSFAAAVSKKRLKSFRMVLPAMVIFILYFVQILSVQYLIMAIALIAMFYSIDKWYAFAVLGLAATLQELLWIPIIFVLAYMAATDGTVRGAKTAIGAAAVFLLINGYFILQNPGIFLSHVIAPVNSYLVPFLLSPVPSLLMLFYPVSMHGLELVFYVSIAIGAVAVYISRNKVIIASMSLLAYFFLYHTLVAYFAFSITMLFFIAVMETDKEPKRAIKKHDKAGLNRNRRIRTGYAALSALAILLIFVVAYSHYSYLHYFGVNVSYEGMTDNGTYAVIGISNNGIEALNASIIEVYSTNSIEENTLGFSVSEPEYITNMSSCDSACMKLNYINYNILELLPKHSYRAKIFLPQNTSSLRCDIYTKYYYYECPAIIINKLS
jgi:hypothetical protein